jgi:hypothetical protein
MKIIAICGSRVIFGNERAFRDALVALQSKGHEIVVGVPHEAWNVAGRDFFEEGGLRTERVALGQTPLKGWYINFIREAIPRYISTNRFIRFHLGLAQKQEQRSVILLADISNVLNINLIGWATGTKVILRCGAAPPTHNAFWCKIILPLARTFIDRIVVDSRYIAKTLTEAGFDDRKITIIRPMPPLRFRSAKRSGP